VLDMPFLEELTLEGAPAALNVPSFIDAPRLRSLALYHHPAKVFDQHHGYIPNVLEWVAKYAHQLKSLAFSNTEISKVELIGLLEALDGLENLEVWENERMDPADARRAYLDWYLLPAPARDDPPGVWDEDIIRRLTPPFFFEGDRSKSGDLGPYLLPHLQFLGIRSRGRHPFRRESLELMIKARKEAVKVDGSVGRLRKVLVSSEGRHVQPVVDSETDPHVFSYLYDERLVPKGL